MAKLVLKLHNAIIKEIDLNKPSLSIGRDADNDLVVDDPAVSRHHARIEQVQSVFFLQDLGSGTGTFANGRKIDRKQLVNGDLLTFGQHALLYQEDVSQAVAPPPARKTWNSDKTVYVSPEEQRDLFKSQEQTGTRTLKSRKHVGVLQVIAGSTDRKAYEVTASVAVIGSQDDAAIKLTGWFAPKQAAVLNRLGRGYAVSLGESRNKVLVNGSPIQAQTALKDGDLIEVARIKLLYSEKFEA